MSGGTSSGYLGEEPRQRVAPTAVRRTCKTSVRKKSDSGGEATVWRRDGDDPVKWESNGGGTDTTVAARRRHGDGVAAPAEDGQKQRGQKLQHKESRRATQR
ncbi:hypothetical protein LINPERHAP2_LOCUS9000 [Linum perenne]